jgi:hypothetical protein
MDYQVLFNSAFAIILLLLGWGMRALYDSIGSLRNTDADIHSKVNELAVALPTEYVHKNDFREMTKELFSKLDRIETKLDSKADKH